MVTASTIVRANLLNDLLAVINSNLHNRYTATKDDPLCTLRLKRSLKLLQRILKELATVKMPAGVRTMAKIVDDLYNLMFGYYSTLASRISAENLCSPDLSPGYVYDEVLLAQLVYKSVSKMATWSWNRIDKAPNVEQEKYRVWVK